MVFVPCLSQDMDPISDMSYSNQAVPVESRILDVPERPVTVTGRSLGRDFVSYDAPTDTSDVGYFFLKIKIFQLWIGT